MPLHKGSPAGLGLHKDEVTDLSSLRTSELQDYKKSLMSRLKEVDAILNGSKDSTPKPVLKRLHWVDPWLESQIHF